MTGQKNTRMAGFVLVGAALLGVIAMSVFPRAQRAMSGSVVATTTPPAAADTARAAGAEPEIVVPRRERIPAWISQAGIDSLTSRCVATVKQQLSADARDSTDVAMTELYGVKAVPGRAQDSLIVEGTARGIDTTAAVWHCGATAYPNGAIATVRAVAEDGWPGVPSRFEDAHAITIAAEDFCLQRTKRVLKEYEFRGVKRLRIADTLRVTGEAMPLNTEDLAADFHCSAVVRNNRIVSAVAATGK